MSVTDKIIYLAEQNNGFVTAAMVSAEGISRGNLSYLVDKGKLEMISRGVYALPDILEDEFFSLQTKYKQGVFCAESALFLLDLTDRTPLQYKMCFPSGYNLTNAKSDGLICAQQKREYYEQGVIETLSPSGNKVKCYCAEKTLCDILRPHMHCDIQIITDAFKKYAILKDKDIPKLSEYAKLLRVEKKVRSYLEVLL